MKTKIIIFIFIILYTICGYKYLETLKKQNDNLNSQIKSLNENINIVAKQDRYAITLSPSIVTSPKATFGKVSNLTIQYYFKLDGKLYGISPDSTIVVKSN